jgi:hypothetical protein
MWFDYGMKKKKKAGPGEAGYPSCTKFWPMVEHAKKALLALSHTTQTAQSGEQPSTHKELRAVAAVVTQKTITVQSN